MISIRIPGRPKPGTGFRFTRGGHTYTAKKTSDWQAMVRIMALDACRQPLDGPLAVHLVFVRRRPSSWPKRPTQRNPWPWAAWTRPDCDNLTKPVMDALAGVIWHDDGQVVRLQIDKRLGEQDEVLLHVKQLTEEDYSHVCAN